MSVLGQQVAIGIVVHLIFIAVTWWAPQAVNIDPLIKRQSRAGKTPDDFADNRHWNNRCEFLLDYLNYSQRLPYLF